MVVDQVQNVIFPAEKNIVKVDAKRITSLKEQMELIQSSRIRLCLHQTTADNLHEMIILLKQGEYVRPHRHPIKTETFHVIKGLLKIVIFDDSGQVSDQFDISDYQSGKTFIFRLAENIWHTVIPFTDSIFHEITNGPFTGKDDSVFPEWAPFVDDQEKVKQFFEKMFFI